MSTTTPIHLETTANLLCSPGISGAGRAVRNERPRQLEPLPTGQNVLRQLLEAAPDDFFRRLALLLEDDGPALHLFVEAAVVVRRHAPQGSGRVGGVLRTDVVLRFVGRKGVRLPWK